MTINNKNLAAAVATIRTALENAKIAPDVINDPIALKALDEITVRANNLASAIERLERDMTLAESYAVSSEISALYRSLGDLQAIAATAPARRGGYKGAAATNAARALSSQKRQQIRDDFDSARRAGSPKEEIYAQLARRYKVSDRTIRRAVSNIA